MNDAISTADSHLKHALDLLRAEETARTAAFEREVAQLRQKIRAVEALVSASATDTAPVTWQTQPRSQAGAPPVQGWARRLQGMTHVEALIQIAEDHNGEVRTAEAKRILLAAGLIKGQPKNALSHIYHLLGKSTLFERVSPGTFRLISHGTGSDPATLVGKLSENQGEERPALPA